jgi:hypothetical protein
MHNRSNILPAILYVPYRPCLGQHLHHICIVEEGLVSCRQLYITGAEINHRYCSRLRPFLINPNPVRHENI